ncbi:MAG: peroxiredoxin, partial [Prevotellaceae bacterium]|nr:peroxiredoxin [Prevotellaceae bacterium]
ANPSGCTAEACSLQAHKAELEAAGYAIIGVSKDKETLQKKFADAQGLEFPLIADTETTLLQTLGCWGEKVACGRRTVGTLRTTYLVDENGIIEKVFTPKEIKTKIHAEQILKYINEK